MSEFGRKAEQQNRLKAKIEQRQAEKLLKAPPTMEELTRMHSEQATVTRALTVVELQEELVREEKKRYQVINKAMMYDTSENQGSKAIASTYHTKIMAAHDKRAAANVHHTGSHYVMAGSKQFQKGVRVKGVVSRHSKQAAKRNGQNTRNGVHNKKDGSMAILT